MRRRIGVSLLLIVLLTAAAVASDVAVNLQSVVIEDFNDGASRWIVRGSKFLAVDDEQTQYDYPFDYQMIEGIWPAAMGRPDAENPTILGVQASFTRRGYNYLEFIPVEAEDDADGNPVPRLIGIPGRPLTIDLWAWGSNHYYYLEVQVRDYRGIIHTLRLGDLGHSGWRNLRVDIPNYIPRTARFVPQRRQMDLVKVVLWTIPNESVAGFHFYLDQIRVLTDLFEPQFDGDRLATPEFVREVWGTELR